MDLFKEFSKIIVSSYAAHNDSFPPVGYGVSHLSFPSFYVGDNNMWF